MYSSTIYSSLSSPRQNPVNTRPSKQRHNQPIHPHRNTAALREPLKQLPIIVINVMLNQRGFRLFSFFADKEFPYSLRIALFGKTISKFNPVPVKFPAFNSLSRTGGSIVLCQTWHKSRVIQQENRFIRF